MSHKMCSQMNTILLYVAIGNVNSLFIVAKLSSKMSRNCETPVLIPGFHLRGGGGGGGGGGGARGKLPPQTV